MCKNSINVHSKVEDEADMNVNVMDGRSEVYSELTGVALVHPFPGTTKPFLVLSVSCFLFSSGFR